MTNLFHTFLSSFSNREIALFTWLAAVLILLLFKSEMRHSLIKVFKALFAKQILVFFLIILSYSLIIVFILRKTYLWDHTLLKDTLFWFFGGAIVMFLNVTKIKDLESFKLVVFESLKWTMIIEFLVNLYTFSLLVELIFIPVFIFISLLKYYSELKPEHKTLIKPPTYILNFIGLAVFVFIIYRTALDYKNFFTLITLRNFLVPPILTILFLPLLYLIALFISYESLFVRINHIHKDDDFMKPLKKEILKVANVNLNVLNSISRNLYKMYEYKNEDLKTYLKSISNH